MSKEYQMTLECSVIMVVDCKFKTPATENEAMSMGKSFYSMALRSFCEHVPDVKNVDVRDVSVVDINPIIKEE